MSARCVVGLCTLVLATGATLAPSEAGEECGLTQLASIDLAFDAVGRPIVPVRLNDVERYLLVDTGGAYSTLDAAAAEALGLVPMRSLTEIVGVTGERSDLYVRLAEFSMGNIRAQQRPFMISPGGSGADSEIRSVGTVAPDLLRHYDLDFDFGSNKLNLFSQDHCEGAVIYWQPQALAIIPFEFSDSGHITFPIELDGVELTALIDTGAAQSTLNRDVAEREFGLVFSAEEATRIGSLGEDDDAVYSHRFQMLKMEGIEIPQPTLTVLPDLIISDLNRLFGLSARIRLPDVIIGMSTLASLHLYIAYGEKRVYITETGGTEG